MSIDSEISDIQNTIVRKFCYGNTLDGTINLNALTKFVDNETGESLSLDHDQIRTSRVTWVAKSIELLIQSLNEPCMNKQRIRNELIAIAIELYGIENNNKIKKKIKTAQEEMTLSLLHTYSHHDILNRYGKINSIPAVLDALKHTDQFKQAKRYAYKYSKVRKNG